MKAERYASILMKQVRWMERKGDFGFEEARDESGNFLGKSHLIFKEGRESIVPLFQLRKEKTKVKLDVSEKFFDVDLIPYSS